MEDDVRYMEMVLDLAEKARGRTSPNPMVGAVIVNGNKIVGTGYHHKAGEPHAEIIALRESGLNAEGSTLYVNLEPCCHTNKRTPPCTNEIIRSGIKRVVIGMLDPNPFVSGKGIDALSKTGIKVECGILENRAKKLNESYVKFITRKKPFVILKAAMSLDGKIALANGSSRWISCDESRRYVHELRNIVDGVMVGVGTIIQDDPELTCRIDSGRDPVRIIIDSNLSIPLSAKVLHLDSNSKTIIATTDTAPSEKLEDLNRKGIMTIITKKDKEGRVSLNHLMESLGELGIIMLLIEGGSKINASALRDGIVDKVIFFYAPIIIGGNDAIGVVGGSSPIKMTDSIRLKNIEMKRSDKDIIIEGYVELNIIC